VRSTPGSSTEHGLEQGFNSLDAQRETTWASEMLAFDIRLTVDLRAARSVLIQPAPFPMLATLF
jgi:hypothetical protein